jgi:predicted GNAT superfamily acetyltransferase
VLSIVTFLDVRLTPSEDGASLTAQPGDTFARVLRDMTDADLERVLAINQANVPEVGDATAAHLARLVAASSISLISIVDAQIAGFCIVFGPDADYDSVNYQWFMKHHPTAMYLDRVAFDARFHGQGLGSEMYAEVDRLIRHEHPAATGLTLEVNIDPPNEPSLAFHRKLGFAEVGRQMSHGIEVSLQHRDL